MNNVAALLAAVEIGDPLTRGSLALFPLFHERPPAPAYVSGPRSTGLVEIHELEDGATVPELEIGNIGALPLLLVDGETLLGAKQNRIITTTTIVPASIAMPVSVTCVEAGRWGDEHDVERSPHLAPTLVRARNRAHVSASVADLGRPEPDQAGVWDEVAGYHRRHAVQSPTSSMEDVYTSTADRVAKLVGGSKPLEGQCGVAAAIDGRVVAVDVFDSPQTLADYWDALVAGYALDAESRRAKHPRRRDVRRFLAAVAAIDGVVTAERVHIAGDGVAATAALLDGTVVHLAASAA